MSIVQAKEAIEQLLKRKPHLQMISNLDLWRTVSDGLLFSKKYLYPEEVADFDALPEELTAGELNKLNQECDGKLRWRLLESSVTEAQLDELEKAYETKLPQELREYLQAYALPLNQVYGKLYGEYLDEFTYPDDDDNNVRHMEEEEEIANTQFELYPMLYGYELHGYMDMSSVLKGSGFISLGGYNGYYYLLLDSENGSIMQVDHEYPMETWGEIHEYGSLFFHSFQDILQCYFMGDTFNCDKMRFEGDHLVDEQASAMSEEDIYKRARQIYALGKDDSQAATLMELVETETGKCKIAALKALAQLHYQPSAPLWEALAIEPFLNEAVLMPSCSDCVSDAIAPILLEYFTALFALPPETALNGHQLQKTLRANISLMLGKGTEKMQAIYRLAAEQTDWIRAIQRETQFVWDKSWMFSNGNLRIWKSTPDELEKLFPAILTASILRSEDTRLMKLAETLFAQYGGSWLMPMFMADIISKPSEQVYNKYKIYLKDNRNMACLCNVFGLMNHTENGYEARYHWGNGQFATELHFKRILSLDERWIYQLAKNPQEAKPIVTMQSFHRVRGKSEDYDEMLLALVPKELSNNRLKRALAAYFTVRAENAPEQSIYKETKNRFGTAKKPSFFEKLFSD